MELFGVSWRSVIVVTVRKLGALPVLKLNMKKAVLFTSVIVLLTTTGCLSSGRSGRWGVPADATVAPPVVAMAASEVIVVRPDGNMGALENILP